MIDLIYKLTLEVNHAITLLYLEDDGTIRNIKFMPSDTLYIDDDSILRYLNLRGLLDPALNLIQIRKEG